MRLAWGAGRLGLWRDVCQGCQVGSGTTKPKVRRT